MSSGALPAWLRRYVLTPIAALLVLGVALRVAAEVGYRPAYIAFSDTNAYAYDAANGVISSSPLRPAGYPEFLRLIHLASPTMTAVSLVQHLLGLATAVLLYLTLRRFDAPRWLAVAAAAVIALVPDFVFFEHAILSESLFLFLAIASLYAAALGLDLERRGEGPRRWLPWMLGAGALLALSAFVRAVGEPLVIAVGVSVAIVATGGARRRLVAGGSVVFAGALLILAYSAVMSAEGGYFGLAKGTGWAIYARVAPIADCSEFTPPAETEVLCETRDPDTRPGPDFYSWNENSPARAFAPGPPYEDDILGSFGRAALVHQPLDYAKLAATDFWRYVDPDAGPDRLDSGHPPSFYRFAGVTSPVDSTTPIAAYFGSYRVVITGLGRTLGDVQQVIRVHGLLVLLALVLAIAGLAVGRDRTRAGIVVMGIAALTLMAVPVAIGTYDSRYALVAYPELIAAGLLGGWALWQRFGGRARPTPGASAVSPSSPDAIE